MFNFYDKEVNERTRGLAFYPFERICAGEIFFDEESFCIAIETTLQNPNKYAQMRKEVTEYLNTYHSNVRVNTYKQIFQ